MSYSVSSQQSYPDAVELVQALRDAGINAEITVGGIHIDPTEGQIEKMHEIAKAAGVVVEPGSTSAMELGSVK